MSMLKTQVGGSNYKTKAIQPIQFIEANAVPFHEGNIIKYVTRWRGKNSLEDLQKARWYIDRLIELGAPKKRKLKTKRKGKRKMATSKRARGIKAAVTNKAPKKVPVVER